MVSKLAKHVDNDAAKQQFGNGYWYGNRTAYNRFARACAEAAVQEHAQLQQQQAQQQVSAHGRQRMYTNRGIVAPGAWGWFQRASRSAAVALYRDAPPLATGGLRRGWSGWRRGRGRGRRGAHGTQRSAKDSGVRVPRQSGRARAQRIRWGDTDCSVSTSPWLQRLMTHAYGT